MLTYELISQFEMLITAFSSTNRGVYFRRLGIIIEFFIKFYQILYRHRNFLDSKVLKAPPAGGFGVYGNS